MTGAVVGRAGTHGNLGDTPLRRRRRAEDPMRAFDALPPPLRRWLAEAEMPWSPASCRRLWRRARRRGESVEAILARLDRAQEACLARIATPPPAHPARGDGDASALQ